MRAALAWALAAEEIDLALRLGAALYQFWRDRDHLSEGRTWLEAALAAAAARPDVAGFAALRARALHGVGVLAWMQGDSGRSQAAHEQSLSLAHQAGDEDSIATAYSRLGVLAWEAGDYPRSRQLQEQALALFRSIAGDDRWDTAFALSQLGQLAVAERDVPRALGLLDEALAIFRQLDDAVHIAQTLLVMGIVRSLIAAPDTAAMLLKESVQRYHDLKMAAMVAYGLQGLATVALQRGQRTHAARLLGADEAIREPLGVRVHAAHRAVYDQMVARLQSEGDAAALAAAWQAGRALSLEEAVAEALAQPRANDADAATEAPSLRSD
jgi:tetratricopeptide (TPR) repeat protein